MNTENNDIIRREDSEDELSIESSADSSQTAEDTDEHDVAESEGSAEQSFSDDEEPVTDDSDEDEDDEDDIAAVAERITGARHSKVSTAAPIRIRENENNSQSVPSPTAIPVRQNASGKSGPREIRMNHPGNPAQNQFTQSMHIQRPQRPHDNRPGDGHTGQISRPTAADTKAARTNAKIGHTGKSDTAKRPTVLSRVNLRTIVITAAVLILLVTAVLAVSLSIKNTDHGASENNGGTHAGVTTAELLENQKEPDDQGTQSGDDNGTVSDETEPADASGDNDDSTDPETPATGDQDDANDTPDSPVDIPEPEPEPTFTVVLSFYDREDITATVPKMTLSEIYDSVGYIPRDTDRPSVPLDFVIAANTTVTIDTVEYKTETVTEVIPYGSEVIETDLIPRGTTNYITYGENGESSRTYTVEYKNGVEQGRTLEYENVTKWAVNEKYEYGVGGSFVGSDGITYTYSHRRTVPATYYSIEGLTYLGTNADETVVAVDPDYIPLGTRLYVKNASYDFGARIAADVGPKVEDWEVDIWISPSNPQLASFANVGYHYDMEIYYID